ncbi:hypothetical protein Dimus_036853, partial [Dionaea muscipula]
SGAWPSGLVIVGVNTLFNRRRLATLFLLSRCHCRRSSPLRLVPALTERSSSREKERTNDGRRPSVRHRRSQPPARYVTIQAAAQPRSSIVQWSFLPRAGAYRHFIFCSRMITLLAFLGTVADEWPPQAQGG